MVEFANYLSFIRDNDLSPVMVQCADDLPLYPAVRCVVPDGPECVVYRQCRQNTTVRVRDPCGMNDFQFTGARVRVWRKTHQCL